MKSGTKRALNLFVVLLCVLTCSFSFIACGKKGTSKKGCSHNWAAATCTAPQTCTKCGATSGSALGHNYVAGNLLAATCTEDGFTEQECTRCHAIIHNDVASIGHSFTATVDKGSCETDEVTTYACDNCDDVYSEITHRHTGHDTAGVAEWKLVSEDTSVDTPCNHIITEKGVCPVCKEEVTRRYVKHVPSYIASIEKAATCREEGVVSYKCVCNNDLYAYKTSIPVNADAHVWAAAGENTLICEVCNERLTVVAKQSGSAVSASELAGDNVAIQVSADNSLHVATLKPNDKLKEKMDGAELSAEPIPSEDFAHFVDPELASKLDKNTPVYNFTMQKDGAPVDFGADGAMKVVVPYGGDDADSVDPMSISVVYIDETGASQEVEGASYTNGDVTFTVSHFSFYTVVRLTPAERCAKLKAHDYKNFVFAPNCTEDGYTLHMCRRCGELTRTDGTKKLGHDYAESVVSPTCRERGYTKHTCRRDGCDEEYRTDFKDTVPHAYETTVVAATCSTKGYTLKTCGDCGFQIKSNITEKTAHSFKNGACTVCGAKDPATAVNNFNMNFVQSALPTNGFYIEAKEIKFAESMQYENSESGGELVVNNFRMQYDFDEDGYLLGKATGDYSLTNRSGESVEISNGEITLVFANKNIYIYTKTVNEVMGNRSKNESYSVYRQDEIFNINEIKGYLEAAPESARNILSGLWNINAKNHPLNAIIGNVIDSLFDKKAGADGYTLTLSYDKTKELVDALRTQNTEQIIDRFFGAGEYQKIYEFIYALPQKTIASVRSEVVDWLNKYGINPADMYNAVNEVMELLAKKSFDVVEFLDVNANKTVAQAVSEIMGEMSADEFTSAWRETVGEFNAAITDADTSFLTFVFEIMDKLSSRSGYMEVIEVVGMSEIVDFALDTLNDLLDALDNGAVIAINTDALGFVRDASALLDDVQLEINVPADIAGRTDVALIINAEGSLYVSSDNDVMGDFNEVVNTIEAQRDKVAIDTAQDIVAESGVIFKLVPLGDGYVAMLRKIVNTYDFSFNSEFVPAKYNGADCLVATARYSNYGNTVLFFNGSFSYEKSCAGWTAYGISGLGYLDREGLEYNVYVDSSYRIIDYTLKTNNLATLMASQNRNTFNTLYYNADKKVWTAAEPHKYVLIDKVEPQKCEEEGYRKYRCTVCGDTRIERLYKWHQTTSRYELVDKAKGCAGGVKVISHCKVCNKDVDFYTTQGVNSDGTHRTFYMSEIVDKSSCGDVVVSYYSCTCGQYKDSYYYVGGDCHFEHLEGNTYRCWVTDCGYTYTVSSTSAKDKDCVVTTTTTLNFPKGKSYTFKGKSVIHNQVDRRTQSGSTVTVETYCEDCGKRFVTYVYDIITVEGYTRERIATCTYHETGEVDRYTYSGCEYTRVRTSSDGTQTSMRGMDHFYHGEQLSVGSCTQPEIYKEKCLLCGYEQSGGYWYMHFHDFAYNSNLDTYVCMRCGMKNESGVNGPVVLEDMTAGENTVKVGYFNRYLRHYDVYFVLDYETEYNIIEISYNDRINGVAQEQGGGIVAGKAWSSSYCNNANYGAITLDRNELIYIVENYDFQTISVVFATTVNDEYEWADSFDYFYECSIHFTKEEVIDILYR